MIDWPSKLIVPWRGIMPRDRPQRGGLAGTVGAEDDDHLALVDEEIETVQHPERP